MWTYTHHYLTQCQSILLMSLLCMLAPIRRHSRIVVVKQLKIYKNETLGCYKEILTITHKLWYLPFYSLSFCFMCWMISILFSFLQENTWKLIFNAKLFVYMYLLEKINYYIYLNHFVVEMAPFVMQLCSFLWPYPRTFFGHSY